jgi:hypothetical protein
VIRAAKGGDRAPVCNIDRYGRQCCTAVFTAFASPSEHKDEMTSTSVNEPSPEASHVRHYHHGQSPAAWAGSLLGLLAVFVGGVAMVLGPNWVLFWISVVIAVAALVVTQALRRAGHGAG